MKKESRIRKGKKEGKGSNEDKIWSSKIGCSKMR
jgi:hypothetical protein